MCSRSQVWRCIDCLSSVLHIDYISMDTIQYAGQMEIVLYYSISIRIYTRTVIVSVLTCGRSHTIGFRRDNVFGFGGKSASSWRPPEPRLTTPFNWRLFGNVPFDMASIERGLWRYSHEKQAAVKQQQPNPRWFIFSCDVRQEYKDTLYIVVSECNDKQFDKVTSKHSRGNGI